MTMTPDTAGAVPRFEDHVFTDPVFTALQKEREAFQAYSETLAGLARIGAFSTDMPPNDLLEQQIALLPDLEAAEAKASAYLVEAEQELLATKPAMQRLGRSQRNSLLTSGFCVTRTLPQRRQLAHCYRRRHCYGLERHSKRAKLLPR